MIEKKYEIKNDLKLKLLIVKEVLKGYKSYLTTEELQGIVDAILSLYYNNIEEDSLIDNLNYRQKIFIYSKYRTFDSYYNQDSLYHIIEYQGKKYGIESDSMGYVNDMSICNLRSVIPSIYEYTKSLDHKISLEGLCYILHNSGVKCDSIMTTIKNRQIEVLIKEHIIDNTIKYLIINNEPIDRVNSFVNMLNKEFNMSIIMPEVDIKKMKKVK